jgi:beta-glucosidase
MNKILVLKIIGIVLAILFCLNRLICYTLCRDAMDPPLQEVYRPDQEKYRYFKPAEIRFPTNFTFGSCSSAYQVEKNVRDSDWSLTEQQTDKHGNPKVPPHLNADMAIEMFDTDLEILKSLNLRAYRFGLSWSALNPAEDVFDDDYLQNYVIQCQKLVAAGLRPMITLWHSEVPGWIYEKGGVLADQFVNYFIEFVEHVLPALSPYCDTYFTINEPEAYGLMAYLGKQFPPQHLLHFKEFFRSTTSLMTAHARAYATLHKYYAKINRTVKVSFTQQLIPFVPRHKWSGLERILCYVADFVNRPVMDCILTGRLTFKYFGIKLWSAEIDGLKDSIDFIAINHYTVIFMSIWPGDWYKCIPLVTNLPNVYEHADTQWTIVPDSLAKTMEWVDRVWNPRHLKMTVSEHGISDVNDTKREMFLSDALGFLSESIRNGLPVENYMEWSLLDNYEWADGYTQHFGLTAVDLETQERTVRESAKTLANIFLQKE